MAVTREDIMLLLKLDEVYKPGTAARKLVFSDELADVAASGTFFETYALDSDERFWVNEVASYFERLATLWKEEIVDPDLAVNWLGAGIYWDRIGPILLQSREIFGSDQLWTDFEALARAQREG